MSIRPIDMQVTVQRTTDTAKPHQQASDRPEIAQKQFTNEVEKEAQLNDQAVVQRNKSEGADVDKDGKGSGGSSRDKSKRSRNEKDKENKENAQPLSMFDVSI